MKTAIQPTRSIPVKSARSASARLPADDGFAAFDEYQRAAARTDQNRCVGLRGLAFPLLGLFGEVGSLVSAVKKKQREREAYAGYSDELIEEFGDVLWYFANVTGRGSFALSDIAREAARRHEHPNGSSERLSRRTSADSATENRYLAAGDYEQTVIALAGQTGMLLNAFHAGRLETDKDCLFQHLVNVFCALAESARTANVSLHEAASYNVAKIDSRWPTIREYAPLFDNDFPVSEQLPRKLEMHILEIREAGRSWVIQLLNDTEIGSPLTDNKIVADDYRFHDVFHLAFAAVLGWSPCLRALLKVKRKSRSEIDENEDGARAALTEEGLSALVFQNALRLNYFENLNSLDYSLLKSIRDFVSGYEVQRCPLWQWEKAILDGFAIFRELRRNRRGVVIADLVRRSVTFQPHPDDR